MTNETTPPQPTVEELTAAAEARARKTFDREDELLEAFSAQLRRRGDASQMVVELLAHMSAGISHAARARALLEKLPNDKGECMPPEQVARIFDQLIELAVPQARMQSEIIVRRGDKGDA